MPKLDLQSIRLRIMRIVRQSGMNQSQLAEFLSITQPAVSKYMRERIPPPGVLFDLAQLGKTSMEWILTGKDEPTSGIVAEPPAPYGTWSLEDKMANLPLTVRRQFEALIEVLLDEFVNQGRSNVSSMATRARSR